jgi:peptide subunit release factor 1 (eRF1)
MLAAIYGLKELGKAAWGYLPENTKLALRSSVTDIGVSALSGKRSAEDWAKDFIEAVDRVKEKGIKEHKLTYVGGKLKFSVNREAQNKLEAKKVIVSFELYFQDSDKKWAKCGDSSEFSKLFFTQESVEAIEKDGIEFEIT